MQFGKIDGFILLGGGQLVAEVAFRLVERDGIVYKKNNGAVFVATSEGSLVVKEIFNSKGTNLVDNITVGDRFDTPNDQIEKARALRAVYTPKGLRLNKDT